MPDPDDAGALARIINEAFIVEALFKIGDRTSADEVVALMNEGGEFLVSRTNWNWNRNRNWNYGCVYLRSSGDRGYFGMLSIDPPQQGQGPAGGSSRRSSPTPANGGVGSSIYTS